MKVLVTLISLLAISSIFLFNQQTPLESQQADLNLLKLYQSWKSQNGMNFNGSQDAYRFAQFKLNYDFIQQYNQQNNGVTLGLTQFAAMSNEEYRQTLNLNRAQQLPRNNNIYKSQGVQVPDEIDWVKKGAVLPARNQGSCGSCWAFSTVGGLQGLMQIVTGNIEYLSVQQVTSCVPAQYLDNKTEGCGGGLPEYAYQYTAQYGIESEEAYPYVNASGGPAANCQYNKEYVVFQNEGIGFVDQKDVQGMKENLANQPLSIGIDAGGIAFQLYTDGVITSGCGTSINHSIIMVGMDAQAETPYWLVQNSWGTSWGDNGYGKIAISEGEGVCAINMEVNFPTSVNQ